MIDPLVVLDENLQVQTGNRAFYQWFGASREQTPGILLSDLGDDNWKASGLWPSLRATLFENREFQAIELERDDERAYLGLVRVQLARALIVPATATEEAFQAHSSRRASVGSRRDARRAGT